MDDESIRVLLRRLARPHPSGGAVVERAALLAEGADFAEVMRWIDAHAGAPEAATASTPRRGLHGSRIHGGATPPRNPSRYVLPAGALG